MINASFLRGLSFITSLFGGNDAKAPAAKVSMIRLTHNIWVTVSGNSWPNIEPKNTITRATTLMVSWNKRNRWIFWYKERPHMTAVAILLNESSSKVISLASFATEVPVPIESPTLAWFRAGASLVPSPVTATICPSFWSSSTNRCLSVGRARHMTFSFFTRSKASSSGSASKSVPVMMFSSVSSGFQMPIWRAISRAVAVVSPVTILTWMPAFKHSATAAGTSSRTGSEIATNPRKMSPVSANSEIGWSLFSFMILYANPRVRIAWFW